MKNRLNIHFLLTITFTMIFVLAGSNIYAQRNCYYGNQRPMMSQKGYGSGNPGYGIQPGQRLFARIPDLTDDQKSNIQKLQTEFQRTRLEHRNRMQELQARYQQLVTAETINQSALDEVVQQMGTLHTDMLKVRTQHRMAVRGELTDDQRVIFDSMRHRGARRF